MPGPERDFLLIGGYGYLGSNVAPYLARRGYRVTVLARKSSAERRRFLARVFEKAGVEVVLVDGEVSRGDVEALAGRVIVNMAGVISGSHDRMKKAHVELTKVAADAAASTGARLVFISAVAAVGRLPGGLVTDGPPSETRGAPENPYEETKAEGERVLETHEGLSGKWVVVRPGLIVGANAYHPEWRALRRLARLRLAPRLGAAVPFTLAVDVAKVLEASLRGVLDGLAVMPVAGAWDVWEVTAEACRLAGRRCRPLPASWALKLCPLSPSRSRLRVACAMLRRRYRYEPRVAREKGIELSGFGDVASALTQLLFSG